MPDCMFLLWPDKNCNILVGKFHSLARIYQIQQLQMTILISLSWKDCKRNIKQFIAQKDKKFCRNGILKEDRIYIQKSKPVLFFTTMGHLPMRNINHKSLLTTFEMFDYLLQLLYKLKKIFFSICVTFCSLLK